MRCFGLFLACFILCSCGTHTATDSIADSAINAATAIEHSLPKECATDSIKTQIKGIKSQITAMSQACESEKAAIRADKTKWQVAFFALLFVVGAYIAKKVLK